MDHTSLGGAPEQTLPQRAPAQWQGQPLLCQQEMRLELPLATARRYITTAQRILDYYPMGIAAQQVTPTALICRSRFNASYIEQVASVDAPEEATALMLKVTSAVLFKGPFSAQRIQQQAFMTMYEHWQLLPESGVPAAGQAACRLIKTWYQPALSRWRVIPLGAIVAWVAPSECDKLVAAWQGQAKCER